MCVYLCVYVFLEMYIKMKDNSYMMKTIAFLVGIVYKFQFHVICTEIYAWFRLAYGVDILTRYLISLSLMLLFHNVRVHNIVT